MSADSVGSAFAQIPDMVVPTIDNTDVVAFEGVNAHQSMKIGVLI